jgi:uncharacterized protein (DUF2344 family)
MDQSYPLPSNLSHWIESHIQKPITGFEHKKNADGKYYSSSEQLKATHYQLNVIAKNYLDRGKSAHEIIKRLEWFID